MLGLESQGSGNGETGVLVGRAGVIRSSRDGESDQSEASITLSDQSEACADKSMICSSCWEKDNGEREHSLIHAAPSVILH